MAGKKDFTAASTRRVYNVIEEATAAPATQAPAEEAAEQAKNGRKAYTGEQAEAMREAGTTQGRKGCKAIRINMAFTPEVHEYIKTMARVRGESITEFTNYIFRQSMEQNAALYAQARAFKNSI